MKEFRFLGVGETGVPGENLPSQMWNRQTKFTYNHWLAALVKGKCSSTKPTCLATGVVCHPTLIAYMIVLSNPMKLFPFYPVTTMIIITEQWLLTRCKRKHILPQTCNEACVDTLRISASVKPRNERRFGLIEMITEGWVHKWMRYMFNNILIKKILECMQKCNKYLDNNNCALSFLRSLCEIGGDCFGPRYFSEGAQLLKKNTEVQNNHQQIHTMTETKMVQSYYCH